MSTPTARARFTPEKAFGEVLRRIRKDRGLSQDELGFKSGYHRTYISQLERGEKSPSLRTIINLGNTLNVRASFLLKRVENRIRSG